MVLSIFPARLIRALGSAKLSRKLMKAIVYRNYGSPDVLKYEEIEKPSPGDDEVLVKVRAASVNPLDWRVMRGRPYFMRIMTGLRKPKDTRLGVDVAGQVEAVGRNVTQFKPGEEVFGACSGAFAEYACASASALVTKPNNVTFEQAAAVNVGASTALQGLRDAGQIQPGQKVLINGAAGGVGTFAVQIAKSFGAEVTGVCSTRNADMVRSIGADQVIDYTREDFTRSGQRYDLLFDLVGNRPLSACRRVLNPKGIYVVAGGPDGRWLGPLGPMIKAPVLSPFVSQKLVMLISRVSKEDLTIISGLMEAGKVTPVIDRRYGLTEVPEAIWYLEEGHARGKVVITLEHDDKN
jgi:NADPH:quinone reductase-like Zn-dependent oxidoreductase